MSIHWLTVATSSAPAHWATSCTSTSTTKTATHVRAAMDNERPTATSSRPDVLVRRQKAAGPRRPAAPMLTRADALANAVRRAAQSSIENIVELWNTA